MFDNQLVSAKKGKVQKPDVLILVPTRELAIQIEADCQSLSKDCCIQTALLYGEVNINDQYRKLVKGCSILVATPGRLIDFVSKECVEFSKLKFLIFDEADRLLEFGFRTQIQQIVFHSSMPKPVCDRVRISYFISIYNNLFSSFYSSLIAKLWCFPLLSPKKFFSWHRLSTCSWSAHCVKRRDRPWERPWRTINAPSPLLSSNARFQQGRDSEGGAKVCESQYYTVT